MDLKLSGRTVLVTGSSKGIGLSVAQWFAREGVNVCMVARSGEQLEREGNAIAKETGVTGNPRRSVISFENCSRRSRSRPNARTLWSSLTSATASSCVRACNPVPMIPAMQAPSRAITRVATPLAAPVRTCPR